MKKILISIKPEWVAKILNGNKTVEIRKTMPKCELPCKVYIYETKSKFCKAYFNHLDHKSHYYEDFGKGKVVAEFTLKNIVKFDIESIIFLGKSQELMQKSCLGGLSLRKYLGNKTGYAWGIDDLKIYDKPKELSAFRKDLDCDDYPCNKGKYCEHDYYDWCEGCSACAIDFDGEHCIYKTLKRPPQSWCYVEKVYEQ